MKPEWYESFFTPLAFDFWQAAVPPALTAAEVDFLVRELAVSPPAKLLDLPSGLGRHSLLLAGRGFEVTGIDISSYAVATAQTEAETTGVPARFILGDMRDAPPGGPYAGALCVGNSFCYLSHADTLGFARNVLQAVAPGGRWVIDTGAVAESLLPFLVEERVLEAGGVRHTVRNHYEAAAKRLVQSVELARGTELQKAEIYSSVYTLRELHQLLEEAGWNLLHSCGSLDGAPFRQGDRRLLLVAERPSAQSS